jgi:hypothetical protein
MDTTDAHQYLPVSICVAYGMAYAYICGSKIQFFARSLFIMSKSDRVYQTRSTL